MEQNLFSASVYVPQQDIYDVTACCYVNLSFGSYFACTKLTEITTWKS